MKTFFVTLLVLAVGLLGLWVGGGAVYLDFQARAGISYSDFIKTHKLCEDTYGEKCRIYGGFAPESSFRD